MIRDHKVEIRLYDTAGQEKLKSQTNICLKKADGVLLMFDITQKHTFEQLSFWYEQIENNVPKQCKVLLLGNKNDLI